MHQLDFEYVKPKALPRQAQEVFIQKHERLMRSMLPAGTLVFADAGHPQCQGRPAHGWFIRADRSAIRSTTDRSRLNLHGALDLENNDADAGRGRVSAAHDRYGCWRGRVHGWILAGNRARYPSRTSQSAQRPAADIHRRRTRCAWPVGESSGCLSARRTSRVIGGLKPRDSGGSPRFCPDRFPVVRLLSYNSCCTAPAVRAVRGHVSCPAVVRGQRLRRASWPTAFRRAFPGPFRFP